MHISSTGVGSTSFGAQVTQGIVSSGFPAKMNAACDFPVGRLRSIVLRRV